MIFRSGGGNIEVRDAVSELPPGRADAQNSAGIVVTRNQALGLPAVLGVIQSACWPASSLPCMVYRPNGDGSDKARDTLQWTILHDEPNGDQTTPQQMWWVVLASILGHGGAALLKLKARGRVVGLAPQHPDRWTVFREKGELKFRFGSKTLTRQDVIYIPGDLLFDAQIGVTPLAIAREAVAAGRAQQLFEGRYYATDGSPRDVITLTGNPNKTERREFLESWEARHSAGTRRTGLLWGGAEYTPIGVNLKDAEYANAAKLTADRVCDLYGMPRGMLDLEHDANPEDTHRRYRELFLQPRLTAIEQALHADPDLFPDKTLFPRFNTNALLRPSLKDRADSYRLFRQGGVLTANELRALEDYPPHDGGDDLQATPVGGAPNPPS